MTHPPISPIYERLEDVVSQQLNLSPAVGRSNQTYDAPERRKYFRCPYLMETPDAVLCGVGTKQRWERVQMIDQSSTSFAVSYRGKETFQKGQVLMMKTRAGRHEVRVIYALKRVDELRVGLERLRDNPEVSGNLSAATLFLVVIFASMSIFTFAIMGG